MASLLIINTAREIIINPTARLLTRSTQWVVVFKILLQLLGAHSFRTRVTKLGTRMMDASFRIWAQTLLSSNNRWSRNLGPMETTPGEIHIRLQTLPSLSRRYKISRIVSATWFQISKPHKCTTRMKTPWWWVWLEFTTLRLSKRHQITWCRRRTSNSSKGVNTTTMWVGKTMIFWASYLPSKIKVKACQGIQKLQLR